MRYVLVTTERRIGKDDIENESVVDEKDVDQQFSQARRTKPSRKGDWIAVALYQEFDTLEELPADGLAGCRPIDRNGKRVLRRCLRAVSW
jgi:hypothetical protein